jgi:hypothetical protein
MPVARRISAFRVMQDRPERANTSGFDPELVWPTDRSAACFLVSRQP